MVSYIGIQGEILHRLPYYSGETKFIQKFKNSYEVIAMIINYYYNNNL